MQENLDEQLEMHEEERLRALHLAHLNQQERAGLLDDDEDEDEEGGDGDEQEGESSYKKAKKVMEEAEEGEAQASKAGMGEGAAGEGAAVEGVAAEGAAAAEGAVAAEGAAAGAAAAAEGAAAEGATAAAAATSEIWIPVLGIIAVIAIVIILVLLIASAMITLCNEKGIKGSVIRGASKVISWLGFTEEDTCKNFVIQTTDENGLFAGGQSGGGGAGATWGKLTDAQARQYLTDAGVTVNAPRPTTSLEGINTETINELIMFKASCDMWARTNGRGACNVVVTGGTEGGHSAGTCSHANGYKFDLRLDPTVTSYIQSTFYDTQTTRSDGARMWQNAAAIYALEGDHWDVVAACGAPAAP